MAELSPIPGIEPGYELLSFLRPYVRHCGAARRPAWRMEGRRLLDYLLVYIADGEGCFSIEEEDYRMRPGDLFWVPPDTVTRMEGYPPRMVCPYVHFDLVYQQDHSHWDFTIPGGMLDLGELQPLMHPKVDHAVLNRLKGRIRSHTNRRVGELIRDICAEAARAQPYAGIRMSGLMVEVVAEVLRGTEGLPLDSMSHIPLLEEAADRMIEECSEQLSVAEFAEACRLSVSHFRHLFKRHFGCSPRTYLRRARLRKAKELMVSTPLTISEIAEQVGFESVHSLSKAFKETEGISPSEYRRCADTRVRVEGRKVKYSR